MSYPGERSDEQNCKKRGEVRDTGGAGIRTRLGWARLVWAVVSSIAIALGLVGLQPTAASADLTGCPTVDSTTGDVTPPPVPGVDWSECNLSFADLSFADLTRADLSGANLFFADMSGANLTNADLSGAYLYRAGLSRAHLDWADLSGANLNRADLTRADLVGATLIRANLSGARAPGANLALVILTDADLSGSDLSSAYLYAVIISGANLSSANLFDATGCEITGAPTAWPSGFGVVGGCLTDLTAPVVSHVLVPASPGDGGWYREAVALTWSVSDPQSTITKIGCAGQAIGADQPLTSYTCEASSRGGTTGPVSVKVGFDATSPVVTGWSSAVPADGGQYYAGELPDGLTCTGSDALSGLTDQGCSVDGYSTVPGEHTATARVTDLAGNTTTETRNYTVLAPLRVTGFYEPVDMGGVVNTVKAGQSVPLKFEVFRGSTELTDVTAVKSFTQQRVPCDPVAVSDAVELVAAGGTRLLYDAASGQFIQNWKTPSVAGACYRVTVTTQDGSGLTALFKLR